MTEYGGGINNGPAGQVGGGGGGGGGAGSPSFEQPDVFASVSNAFNDTMAYVSSLPFEVLVAGIVIFFVGLIVLKRAF